MVAEAKGDSVSMYLAPSTQLSGLLEWPHQVKKGIHGSWALFSVSYWVKGYDQRRQGIESLLYKLDGGKFHLVVTWDLRGFKM